MFCQKLFHANLIEANPDGGSFLLVANDFGQCERARHEEQHGHGQKQPLPEVQWQEQNPAQRAEQAHAERDRGLQKEGRGVLGQGFKVVMMSACRGGRVDG
jgi:hypothetical protein